MPFFILLILLRFLIWLGREGGRLPLIAGQELAAYAVWVFAETTKSY
ncbi:hypothetical protein [Thalassolituus maritimus]|nr:hypothetical protein [Thalassolituus maritimus]